MKVIEITKNNFDNEVLKSDIPVLVDLWAEWCAPCMMLKPILEEIAEDFDGRFKICKINIDNEGEFATRFNVISIPTLLVFNKGELVNKAVGVRPKNEIMNLLNSL